METFRFKEGKYFQLTPNDSEVDQQIFTQTDGWTDEQIDQQIGRQYNRRIIKSKNTKSAQ